MNRTADPSARPELPEVPAATTLAADPTARDMTVHEVRNFLHQLVEPAIVTSTETVALHDALGRVLAADLLSPISVPPHDNAAMDGYAFDGAILDAEAASDASASLRVIGTALAGCAWKQDIAAGEAVRIMTGAMMPRGLDTVVPQEFCIVEEDHVRFPLRVLRRGDNRRLAGEDLMQGRSALPQGERLLPAALGTLASLGLSHVTVLRRLRIAYFSTGDEILSLGDAPREGAVFDSNRTTLFGLLTRLGCEIVDLGRIADDPSALAATLAQAASQADAILTSGGMSVGEADHMREVMRQAGEIVFCNVAMRPGRPMAVGLVPSNVEGRGPAVLFGLPGNPVATMVSFLALVRPALLRMMGCHDAACAGPPMLRATSSTEIRKKAGRTEYQRAWVTAVPDSLPEVRVADKQGSGVLSSMVAANGLVVLHHEQGNIAAGESVDVMMFEGIV